ncbi:MAG: type II toxin-antitoxin system HicB family antitoxin [Candidatus Geothermarchaeales archaeon]
MVATVPSLPGCISQGRTEEDALANIKEAIELYLETLEEEYRELTREKKKVKEITVTISK